MLSQTKMQLWYPKKVTQESSTLDSMKFQNKCRRDSDDRSVNIKNAYCQTPTTFSDKSDDNEDIDVEFLSEDCSSQAGSLGISDCEEEVDKKRRRGEDGLKVSDFVDLNYWKKENICCGTIFRGMHDEIIVDSNFLKPCKGRLAQKCISIRNKHSC